MYTYAWFVSNNSVKATTSTISAQSNAAFMYIRDENEDSTDLRVDTSQVGSTALYPAHWVTNAENEATGNYSGKTVASFYTAYGTTAGNGAMKTDTLDLVKSGQLEAGSKAAALAGQYAVKNTFKVGSKGTTLKNLVVASAALKNENDVDSTSENNSLDDALRVLVTCGENWVLCDKSSIIANNKGDTTHLLAETISADETTIEIYVFYDGDATNITTNNLSQLKVASKSITVQFTATPTTTQTAPTE